MTDEITFNYVHRTLCISAEQREMAQLLCGLDPSGQGMFLRAYGTIDEEGEPTIIGYISSGLVAEDWYAAWPLKTFNVEGELVSETFGNPSSIIARGASLEEPVVFTPEQVQEVFDNCDISNQPARVALARTGYVLLS